MLGGGFYVRLSTIINHMNHVRTRMPQVALLLPTSIKTCRELLRGVLHYVHLHGPWTVHIIEGREDEQKLSRLETWDCTGIIANLESRFPKHFLKSTVPTIITNPQDKLLDPSSPFSKWSQVVCDNHPIGKRAAEYFLERKFRHFAFVGQVNSASWSEERRTAFCERLSQDGFSCVVYPKLSSAARKNFSVEQSALCDWLKALPKPAAILVANDVRGRQVLNACLKAGVAVPQEVSVLGVDNDEMLCETAHPQLSSIQMTTEQAGFEAARLLDSMMHSSRRGLPKQTIITYGFSHLVTRRSTETVQIADALIARALEFIRINASTTLAVEDLLRHLGASRRLVEKRFKAVTGRTVYAEIMRVRLERVQMMVRETPLTIEAIADTCGFASASHLSMVYKKHFDMTLSSYRRQTRESAG